MDLLTWVREQPLSVLQRGSTLIERGRIDIDGLVSVLETDDKSANLRMYEQL